MLSRLSAPVQPLSSAFAEGKKISTDEISVLLPSIIHNVRSLASLKKDKERRKIAIEGGREAGYFRRKD